MSSNIVVRRMDFQGDELLLADVNGEPWVVLKPVMEYLGVDWSTQLAKLKERSWASYRDIPTTGKDGKTYQMVACDLRTFFMFLATINELRVAEHVRPKLVAYQRECADVIQDYWTKGGAINPRATSGQLITLLQQAELLQALKGVVDPHYLDNQGRFVLAKGLGNEPTISYPSLTVSDYLEEKGADSSEIRSFAPQFGKRLKQKFTEKYGKEPSQNYRMVEGVTRPVCIYTEEHRPLFDAVLKEILQN